MAKRRWTQYDDDFRAGAMVMLESQGYPDQRGALQSVADHLHIPKSTLRGWWIAKHSPSSAKIRTLKRREFQELIRDEIYAALSSLDNTRDFATYKELVTGIAILIDKLQLLDNKPTERIAHELSDSERANRVNALLELARDRRAGRTAIDADDGMAIH